MGAASQSQRSVGQPAASLRSEGADGGTTQEGRGGCGKQEEQEEECGEGRVRPAMIASRMVPLALSLSLWL